MTDFLVEPDALDVQAARATALAERVRRVANTARPLDVGAYGLVGSVFALAALSAASTGSDAVGRVAGHADRYAEQVRQARDAYRRVERRAAAGFRGPP